MKISAFLRHLGLALVLLFAACSKAPERQPKLYRSPMHPWITSDKPGNCTICGMELVPEYDTPVDSGSAPVENTLQISAQTREVLGIATAPVTREPLTGEIRVSGILEDDETLHRVIAAFYEGRIEKVYVQQVGQRVEAGQPLASIYSPELLYVVREYQNAVERGKNDPIAVNSRLRLIQFGLAPAQVDALAKRDREVYTIDILAPMDGTVLVRNAYQGQYVKNGELLFETGNLSRMWFQAEIYERDLAFIRLGQKAVVTSPAAPGVGFEGVVTFIDPSFNPESRSTRVRIEVDNPPRDPNHPSQRLLPHRAYGEAVIRTESAPTLSIPRSALLRDGRREVVFVETGDGRYEMRPVRAGLIADNRAEIVGGLREGERVVTQGNLLLDAEAQLRWDAPPSTKPLPQPLESFLAGISAISAALAEDDLPAAQAAAAHLSAPPDGPPAPPSPPSGETLEAFRSTFQPWAALAADRVLQLTREGKTLAYHVFECPMTGTAFPNAPESARWVQASSGVKNPFFGPEMSGCGSEVKP